MPKYRKTALVEAEQFIAPDGDHVEHNIPRGVKGPAVGGTYYLDTMEGRHILRDGDYICTGPAGEQWNVERSIFEQTYERVD